LKKYFGAKPLTTSHVFMSSDGTKLSSKHPNIAPPDPILVTIGEPFTTPKPTAEGWTFIGWFIGTGNERKEWVDGTSFPDEDTLFTGYWKQNGPGPDPEDDITVTYAVADIENQPLDPTFQITDTASCDELYYYLNPDPLATWNLRGCYLDAEATQELDPEHKGVMLNEYLNENENSITLYYAFDSEIDRATVTYHLGGDTTKLSKLRKSRRLKSLGDPEEILPVQNPDVQTTGHDYEPQPPEIVDGMVVTGWFTDHGLKYPYEIDTLTGDLELYAAVEETEDKAQISYVYPLPEDDTVSSPIPPEPSKPSGGTQVVEVGEEFEPDFVEPCEGYIIEGLYADENCTIPLAEEGELPVAEESQKVYPLMEMTVDQVQVVYKYAQGSHPELALPIPNPQTFNVGDICYPTDPQEMDGFIGWCTDKKGRVLYEPDKIENHLTLYAAYNPSVNYVTITYAFGESAHPAHNVLPTPNPVSIEEGEEFYPENPTIDEEYIFEGWFTTHDYQSGTQFTNGTAVNENIILYAKFDTTATEIEIEAEFGNAVNGHKPTDSSLLPATQTITKGTAFTPLNPTEINPPLFRFDGFYEDKEYEILWDNNKLQNKSAVVYYKFIPTVTVNCEFTNDPHP
jgi:hypothetical protein